MKTKPSYLVVNRDRGRIVRCTASWPTMGPGEFAVRVVLEIPDTLHPTHTIEVTNPDGVVDTTIVEAEPPDDDDA
jgi:hypothetical protein